MSNYQPAGTISVPIANLRSGPDTSYPVVGQAEQGTVLTIIGRNSVASWLQVCCVDNIAGWVWRDLLVVEGSLDRVPIAQSPGRGPIEESQPEPPAVIQGWKGEYFNNRELNGSPVLVRDDKNLHFRWDGASPGPGVPGNNFSARWTRSMDFHPGDYTFFAEVDDGVRVYLDGILLIDQWHISSLRTHKNTFRKLGGGQHTITVDYFQGDGDSAIRVWWEQIGSESGMQPPPSPFPEWKAEYFDNIHVQGEPVVVRNDVSLRFNWGTSSPDPRIPHDNWSARWTRRVHFRGGNYNFFAHTKDGVRVTLDGWKVIDEWHETQGSPTYTGRFENVGEGSHTIIVEYFAHRGNAYARVWWEMA